MPDESPPRSRRRPRKDTAALVLSALALFFALGGSAFAVAYITGADVVDESLTGIDVQDGSLAQADLGGDAVTTSHLAPAAVTRADLGVNSVGSAAVANGSLGTGELAHDFISQYTGQAGTKLNAGQCVLLTAPVRKYGNRDFMIPQGLDYSATGQVPYLDSRFVLAVRNTTAYETYYELCATATGATIPANLKFVVVRVRSTL